MTQQTYALVNSGVVQQLFATDQDISTMFAPGLQWIPVAADANIAPGYLYDGTTFTAPSPPVGPATSSGVNVAQLQAELAALQSAVAALTASH